MKKLSNIKESVWADIHRRSNGEQTRREDDLTNLKDLVPVNTGMSSSVMWADRDLELKDGSYFFTYNEVNELIKDSEWRLPTQVEVNELFFNMNIIRTTSEYYIVANDAKTVTITFYKRGFQYADSTRIHYSEAHSFWTSTRDKNYSNVHVTCNVKHHPFFTTMDDNHKVCVRLVKDKK